MSAEVDVKRRVRQGYILSPIPFNIYRKNVVHQALIDEVGVNITEESLAKKSYLVGTVFFGGN